jgi:hypothetical protein
MMGVFNSSWLKFGRAQSRFLMVVLSAEYLSICFCFGYPLQTGESNVCFNSMEEGTGQS